MNEIYYPIFACIRNNSHLGLSVPWPTLRFRRNWSSRPPNGWHNDTLKGLKSLEIISLGMR